MAALLSASGSVWAPNGRGYGATLWDAVRLGLLTGLRIAELSDLRVKDLVDNQTVVSVPRGKTRNARRVVPLPIAAQQVVALRMADLPDTSPDAPLWPELPVLKLTGSRGGKLSDRFRLGRPRSCRGLTAWISTLYGLASTDVVEIRSDARCGVVVWAGVAIGPVG